MDKQKQKEQFQCAYLAALAAQAGFNPGKLEVDDDSIDVLFQSKGYKGAKVRSPQIQFQLKCTSQDLVKGGVIKFPLSVKNYSDLQGSDFVCPRYLAVLIVPDAVDTWVRHHDEHVSLHNNCFWVSLRDAPETSNNASVTVDVPLSQRLTTDVLVKMMEAASRGVSI